MMPALWYTAVGLLLLLSPRCSAAVNDHAHPLPAPGSLRVDLMDAVQPPLMLVTANVRPSFSFIAPADAGLPMSHYRVLVHDLAGTVAWDSGKKAGGAAVNIKCGRDLKAGASYTWTARYWGAGGSGSAVSSAAFDVGLLGTADWAGAAWLGGGQRQFKLVHEELVAAAGARASKLKLHVASPGGVTVKVGGLPVGDAVGVSLWADNQKSVHYFSFDLTASQLRFAEQPAEQVVIDCGAGFWASNTSVETWGHGQDRDMQPGHVACKILLVSDGAAGRQVVLRSGAESIMGRPGPVLAGDPWRGSIIDLTLPAAAGWEAARLAPDTPTHIPAGALFPLPAPFARTLDAAQAVSVSSVPQRPGTFLYSFPSNIVGHAAVKAGAATGTAAGGGELTLEYCEVWDHTLGAFQPLARRCHSKHLPLPPPTHPESWQKYRHVCRWLRPVAAAVHRAERFATDLQRDHRCMECRLRSLCSGVCSHL